MRCGIISHENLKLRHSAFKVFLFFFHSCSTCPPPIPTAECTVAISCSHEAVFIAGAGLTVCPIIHVHFLGESGDVCFLVEDMFFPLKEDFVVLCQFSVRL